jgi:hypothetical protein
MAEVDPQYIGLEAAHFLRRELERVGVAGQLTPRLVNPRSQGWIYGFVRALGDALELPADERYTLEARLDITLFEGTPMGEQLGLEALMMAQRTGSSVLPGWRAFFELGRESGRLFAAFQRTVASLGDSMQA